MTEEGFKKWQLRAGDLRWHQQIGTGAFGEVWKADLQGTPVAVKKIVGLDKEEVEKYIGREIEALTQLSHPNIVQLLGMAWTEDSLFLVTEFVEGGDLHKLL